MAEGLQSTREEALSSAPGAGVGRGQDRVDMAVLNVNYLL